MTNMLMTIIVSQKKHEMTEGDNSKNEQWWTEKARTLKNKEMTVKKTKESHVVGILFQKLFLFVRDSL